jgi:cell wall-associated NlpC family hydrolase
VTAEHHTSAIANRAVAWALAHRGDGTYALRCLAFVEDAFERANGIEVFGGASAAESAAQYGTLPYDRGALPPRGAFVFYACSGPIADRVADWGHVGLALGDDRVVHAWDEVRVDQVTAVAGLPVRAGWSRPTLIGWAPVDRVLAGHRTRDWSESHGA